MRAEKKEKTADSPSEYGGNLYRRLFPPFAFSHASSPSSEFYGKRKICLKRSKYSPEKHPTESGSIQRGRKGKVLWGNTRIVGGKKDPLLRGGGGVKYPLIQSVFTGNNRLVDGQRKEERDPRLHCFVLLRRLILLRDFPPKKESME